MVVSLLIIGIVYWANESTSLKYEKFVKFVEDSVISII